MQDKIELAFNELPDDVVTDQISPFFKSSSEELNGLISMNKRYYTLFSQHVQPKRRELALLRSFNSGDQQKSDAILTAYPEFQINQLLWYVVSGEQVKAYEMLEKNPKLLLERGSIIDMSGRHFNNITPFELVLWNMDVRYMAGMMLNCIPENKDGNEISEKLLRQYDEVENNGVKYTLNGKEYTESHFSYQPLIEKLETYVTNYDSWGYDECKNYWCKEVGKEQFMLTIEGRNQYCHLTRSFDPKPDFNEEHLERNLKFYNYVNEVMEIWDSRLIGLGTDFGVARGGDAYGNAEAACAVRPTDAAAIRRLCEVRTKDLAALKERLELSIQKSEENQKSHQMIF